MNESHPATNAIKAASSTHRSLQELEAAFSRFPQPPTNSGRLMLIVCRRARGVHEAVEHVRLTTQEGVPGDEWNRRMPRNPDAQLAVIRSDVAELIGCGQPLTTSGDNLVVDLDISAANLPVGTRLRVGEAVVEVTPKPHNGCSKFQGRFGSDALRFVQASATRHLNLRGIYWRIIESGEARIGSTIQVLSRPGCS